MQVLAAGEEVRGRDAALGEPGAVGAAADPVDGRLHAGQPDRFLHPLEHLRVRPQELAHVEVLAIDLHLDGASGVRTLDRAGERLQVRKAPLGNREIEVPDDDGHFGAGDRP